MIRLAHFNICHQTLPAVVNVEVSEARQVSANIIDRLGLGGNSQCQIPVWRQLPVATKRKTRL